MSRSQVLSIRDATDGDGRTPDKSKFFQDDSYYLLKFGDLWSKDLGLAHPANFVYTCDRLPAGYSGWARTRDASTHVDRYLWGHPNGLFRSTNEAWPHFRWLMHGGSANTVPCSCPRCGTKNTPNKRLPRPVKNGLAETNSISSGAIHRSTQHASPQIAPKSAQPHRSLLQHGQFSSSDEAPAARRKQIDEDGVVDVYRALLDKLKNAGPDTSVDEPFSEPWSPDAYVGSDKLIELIIKWQNQPPFIPRLGELVLFVRHMRAEDSIRWSPSANKFRVYDNVSAAWAAQTVWEAGVITQEPTEICKETDLVGLSDETTTNINQSGFRIEPISAPRRHVYVSLHAIRPLVFWQQCVTEENTHPTVTEAIATFKSFCVLDKFHFKGTWPNATVFAKALFIGPELIMVGDLVRFLNDAGEIDMLEITSIKLVFLNLHEAGNDDWDDRRPYHTVLHVSGHAYSLEPIRSFDVIGKVPASTNLPLDLPRGDWYHVTNPVNPRMRVEIPYSRVISRYPGEAAISAWFENPPLPTSTFQPVNTVIKPTSDATTRISRGVIGTLNARKYSELHSQQIARSEGKTWFWADTRVEQLNLKEVNDRSVGCDMVKTGVVKINGEREAVDQTRADMMPLWQSSLQTLHGKSGSVEPWRKTQGSGMRPPSSVPGTMSVDLAVREAQVAAEGQSAVEPTENKSVRTPVASQDDDHSSSAAGSKRSHSDMEIDDTDAMDTAKKMQPTLQRRIEIIDIDDSD